jgi:hypothetical protein
MVDEFIEKLYRLSQENEGKAIDAIYDFMDDNLRAGSFAICAEALTKIEPTRITGAGILSFLIVTRRGKTIEGLAEARTHRCWPARRECSY